LSFWTDERNIIEPKRKNRWVLIINNIKAYTCLKAGKPKYEQGKAEHNYMGHTYYFPGSIKWQPSEVTVVDPVDDPATKKLVEIIERSGYHPLKDVNDYGFVSKKKAVEELGLVRLMQIDAVGNPVETWTLHNAWIENVDFGDLDYEDDGLVQITFTISFDWPTLENGDGTRNFDLGGSNPADTTLTL